MPRRRNPLRKVNDDLLYQFIGKWKVQTAYFNADTSSADENEEEPSSPFPQLATELEGVAFTLDEQYDLTWQLPPGTERIPLFQTNAFDMNDNEIELMGGPDGRSYIFEFKLANEGVQLICPASNNTTLHIIVKKVVCDDVTTAAEFSLLDALEQSYFTDLSVCSSQGQKFAVHRAIVGAVCPGVKYREWEMILSGLSTESLQAALHYIYTSSLPTDIGEGVAKELAEIATRHPKLLHLRELCSLCMENHNLKKKLVELVDNLLLSLGIGRQIIESTELTDPAKLLYAIKQLAKEGCMAIARFVLLCQLYTQNKQEMSKVERKEVLEYVQARVIVCIDQGRELIQLMLSKWESLDDEQKNEIAVYIIPEVERIWGLVNGHAVRLHSAIGNLGATVKMSDKSGPGRNFPWKLSMVLQFNSHMKELNRLKKLNKEFNEFVNVGEQKRTWFMGLSVEEKAERIIRVIQEVAQDGDDIVRRLEDAKKKILVANALHWGNYKLIVSLACSYVSWGINKLFGLKDAIKPIAQRLCYLVGQDELNSTLVQLKLVDPADLFEEKPIPTVPSLPALSPGKHSMRVKNPLAGGCLRLLETQEQADMQFVITGTQQMPSSDSTHNSIAAIDEDEAKPTNTVIPAHRVILAARSEWFRRALQSGMIEDRDRRIVVQDIDISLFRIFLEYLYGKPLDYENCTQEELLELLAVADRYETSSLRLVCEKQLIARVDDTNVFQLLVAADQFSARQLREHTLQHILDNPDVVVTQIDSYSDLPTDIKQEVRLILSGTQDPRQFRQGHPPPTIIDEGPTDEQPSFIPVNPPDLSLYGPDESTIQSAIAELRMIVGDEPTDDMLKDILLAADMDINRALNFFFGAQ